MQQSQNKLTGASKVLSRYNYATPMICNTLFPITEKCWENVYWKRGGGGGKHLIITTICELSCVEAA